MFRGPVEFRLVFKQGVWLLTSPPCLPMSASVQPCVCVSGVRGGKGWGCSCLWSSNKNLCLFILSLTSLAKCHFSKILVQITGETSPSSLRSFLQPRPYSLAQPQCSIPLLLADVSDIELESQSALLLQYVLLPFQAETTQLRRWNGRREITWTLRSL